MTKDWQDCSTTRNITDNTVLLKNKFEDYISMLTVQFCDRSSSYCFQRGEVYTRASGDEPMDVDFLVKGISKGKSEGKEKGDGTQSTTKGNGPINPKFDGTCHKLRHIWPQSK